MQEYKYNNPDNLDGDKPHEACGIFGIYTNQVSNVSSSVYFALYALQHRGQESCGIVVNDGGIFNYKKGMGLVNEVFDRETLEALNHGKIAVGHVRLSAEGQTSPHFNQPSVVRHIKGPMAIATNGSLVNSAELRTEYELHGAIFHSANDAEVISYAIIEQRLVCGSIQEAVEKAMFKLKGAYSVVLMSPQKLIAFRDPHGMKPLCIGELPNGEGWVFASESCALESIGASFLRDVRPGEIVIADENGLSSIETHCGSKGALCVFEYIYFARPDSVIEGASVHNARIRAGEFLALEHPVEADVVVGVPDSGIDAAIGYARASGIPYEIGMIKNKYIGRTFIQPMQEMRENSVRIKLNPLGYVLKDKRVVVIDDSIVRGTTMKIILSHLREAGAKEVHVRISSPPFMNPCYFGTDINSREDLITSRMTIDEIREEIGADSLGYLNAKFLPEIAGGARCGLCAGCFDGKYPMEVPEKKPEDKFCKKVIE